MSSQGDLWIDRTWSRCDKRSIKIKLCCSAYNHRSESRRNPRCWPSRGSSRQQSSPVECKFSVIACPWTVFTSLTIVLMALINILANCNVRMNRCHLEANRVLESNYLSQSGQSITGLSVNWCWCNPLPAHYSIIAVVGKMRRVKMWV